jgi:hypothetical protein
MASRSTLSNRRASLLCRGILLPRHTLTAPTPALSSQTNAAELDESDGISLQSNDLKRFLFK